LNGPVGLAHIGVRQASGDCETNAGSESPPQTYEHQCVRRPSFAKDRSNHASSIVWKFSLFWSPASVTVRWTTLCLIRALRFGHQSRGNTSAVPCFGGLYGSLSPASDGEVFSATYSRLTTAGSACPRLSGNARCLTVAPSFW